MAASQRRALLDSSESNRLLSIPLSGLMEELNCPVCFGTLNETLMTRCGHNFCRECISECLNRKHQCPCCNREAIAADLLPNLHFDRLITLVQAEKDKAHKKYVDSLITKTDASPVAQAPAQDGSSSSSPSPDKPSALSPIEACFVKHMQSSLAVYQDYYRQLEEKLTRSIGTLEAQFAERMVAAAQFDSTASFRIDPAASSSSSSSSSSITGQMPQVELTVEELRNQCNEEIHQLEESFKESFAALTAAYDEFLKSQSSVPPKILPIRVDILLESTGTTFKNVPLKPIDSLLEVKQVIMERCEASDIPIVKFTEHNSFFLRRPFIISDATGTRDIPILEDLRPIIGYLGYEAEPGCVVVLKGLLALKANTPIPCFATQPFTKDASKTDYFTCTTCKHNWICAGCSITCHRDKGHVIKPYLLNNRPSWACCYCPKKKLCCQPK